MIEILHKDDGRVMLLLESDSLQAAAEAGLLDGVDLRGADLRGWDLSTIDFGRADLQGAELNQANLAGTRLDRADLAEADLSGARFDHRTGWPPGFEPQEHGAVKIEWRHGACRLDSDHQRLHAEASRQWKECMARLRAGQTTAAIRELRRAMPGAPASAAEVAYAHFVQGMIRIVKGHTLKALAELREAVRVYPYLAAVQCALAYALFTRGKADEAFAAYQEALRIDSRDRDLFLPLLHAFEGNESLKAQFAIYSELLFPDASQPVSMATVRNPVELFLERQTDRVEKALSILVLSELIGRRPVTVIRRPLLERRPLPDRAANWYVSDIEAPLPELSSTWEFLSGPRYRVERQFELYWEEMMEQGFDREQIRRRLEIVEAFRKLCEEMGFVSGDEYDVYDSDWAP